MDVTYVRADNLTQLGKEVSRYVENGWTVFPVPPTLIGEKVVQTMTRPKKDPAA